MRSFLRNLLVLLEDSPFLFLRFPLIPSKMFLNQVFFVMESTKVPTQKPMKERILMFISGEVISSVPVTINRTPRANGSVLKTFHPFSRKSSTPPVTIPANISLTRAHQAKKAFFCGLASVVSSFFLIHCWFLLAATLLCLLLALVFFEALLTGTLLLARTALLERLGACLRCGLPDTVLPELFSITYCCLPQTAPKTVLGLLILHNITIF